LKVAPATMDLQVCLKPLTQVHKPVELWCRRPWRYTHRAPIWLQAPQSITAPLSPVIYL